MTFELQLRPAESTDRPFLLQLFEQAHGQELLQLLPLPLAQKSALVEMQFAAQQQAYCSAHPQSTDFLISLDGRPVGRVWQSLSPREIRIIDLAVLPQFQKQGIATAVLRQLQQSAALAETPLRLSVQKSNVAAARLYKRLGFSEILQSTLHLDMEFVSVD